MRYGGENIITLHNINYTTTITHYNYNILRARLFAFVI